MIISIFGKDGAGKTTIATHLAKYYANKNFFVGIISCETRYGSLQRVMGVNVEEKQSLLQAILDPQAASKCFTKATENIYVLSMADSTTIKDFDTATALLGSQETQTEEQNKRLERFIDNTKDVFDILIIDCTDRITDILTYTFLSQSDKIINVIQSSLDGIAYENAHMMFNELSIFKGKKINLLNKHNEKIINKTTIEKLLQEKINVAILYDSLYLETDGTVSKKMLRNLQRLEDEINAKNEESCFPSEKEQTDTEDTEQETKKKKIGISIPKFSLKNKKQDGGDK